MATVHPIVSIGFDLPLLQTRAALLEAAGYRVVTVSPDTPSLDTLLRRQPPIVLICHTVKERKLAEIKRLAEAAQAPVLVLERGVNPEHLIAKVAAAIDCSIPPPPGTRGSGPRLAPQVSR